MVTNIESYRGTTREELLAQLEVTEACREFWYRAYVRASTYAIEQIAASVDEAKKQISEQHGECDEALEKMQRKIDHVIRQMFLTDGRAGLHTVLPSAISPDRDSS